MTWIEIAVTVEDGELTEAVAEVLGRYIPDGVFIQATGIVFDPNSEGRGIAPYRVGGYLPEDDPDGARARIETALGHLSLIRPIPEPEYREIEAIDWTESWKANFRPMEVGTRLLILPAWEDVPAMSDSLEAALLEQDRPEAEEPVAPGSPTGRIPIRIDPGMAFGTGTHPTTQLALALLEKALDQHPGADLLDIGCGSGILSIAAARLGAGRVVGVDVDPDSIENAENNAALNGAADELTFGLGSAAEVRGGGFELQTAPIVVANILAHILVRLMEEGLCELVSDGGALILSGILAEREEEVLRTAAGCGFVVNQRSQEGDWVGLSLHRA